MQASVYTDKEIVEGIASRKAVFFHYFYDKYAGVFYREIMKSLPKEEIAVETMQVVFKKIFSGIPQFEYKQSLFTWAFRLVQKEASKKKIEIVLNDLFFCQKLPSVKQPQVAA